MKLTKMVVLFSVLLGVTGCANEVNTANKENKSANSINSEVKSKQTYEEVMSEGKKAIENGDWDKADKAFKKALDLKKDDSDAKVYSEQVKMFKEAVKLKEDKSYKNSIGKLKELRRVVGGSIELKKQAEQLMDEIENGPKEETTDKEKKKDKKEDKKKDKDKKKDEKKDKEKNKDKDKKKDKVKPSTDVVWSSDKSEKLDSFIKSWSKKYDQTYKAYYPGNGDVDFYGVKYPSDLTKNNIALNGNKITTGVSKDGTGKKEYNVVAIYSDIETSKDDAAYLYFFAIAENKPKVIVTTQDESNSAGLVYFSPTDNKELQQGFEDIVAGKEIKVNSEDKEKRRWTKDEAIKLLEKTYKNSGPVMNEKIDWDTYDNKNWLVKENKKDTIAMKWKGEYKDVEEDKDKGKDKHKDKEKEKEDKEKLERSRLHFVSLTKSKDGKTVELKIYRRESRYPKDPDMEYTVNVKLAEVTKIVEWQD